MSTAIRPRIVATYDYRDEDGQLLYQAVRLEPKDFRQRCPDGNGGWSWSLNGTRRVLYRLPELLEAGPERTVFVVEGEKDADNLWAIGCVATTAAMGAKAPWRGEYSEAFRGRHVVILPDNDQPGREHASEVATSLRGVAASVKLVKLPDLPEKGDVSDWLAAGGTKEKLLLLVQEAISQDATWEPPGDRDDSQHSSETSTNPGTEQPLVEFKRLKTSEFFAAEYRVEYLVENVLVKGQPLVVAGGKKNLKTNLTVALAISLASGEPFLGKFHVARPINVGIMSGESGEGVLQETGKRIARWHGLEAEQLDRMSWSFQLPRLPDVLHVDALKRFIEEEQLELLIIDPAYLSMPNIKDGAGNLFAVGETLAPLSRVMSETGCTIGICHHTKQHKTDHGTEPQLEDIAWAGFQEWCRQWLLLARREAYNPDHGGHHALWMATGGSAGHSGLWALDIEEGSRNDPGGRRWEVDVLNPSMARDLARQHVEQSRREAKQKATDETLQAGREKALEVLRRQFPNGMTKTALRDELGFSGRVFNQVLASLLNDREVVHSQVTVPNAGNGRKVDGYAATRINPE